MIDGLELYKAIHHAKNHKESHDHGIDPTLRKIYEESTKNLPDHSPPGVPPAAESPNVDSLTLGTEDIGAIGRKTL